MILMIGNAESLENDRAGGEEVEDQHTARTLHSFDHSSDEGC